MEKIAENFVQPAFTSVVSWFLRQIFFKLCWFNICNSYSN